MYNIKLKQFEIDALDDIKSFELGIITNNSLQGDTLNISHYHFEKLYNIVLDNYDETKNEILLKIIDKLLKHDVVNIIKPIYSF